MSHNQRNDSINVVAETDNSVIKDLDSNESSPGGNINNGEKQITDQTNYLPKSRIVMVFFSCSAVDFLALMDQTNIAVASTFIASDLGAGGQSSWIASAYFLTSTAMTLNYGRLSDVCGRKMLLMVSLFGFFVFTIGSSLSQTMTQLIVFRALSGAFGGGMMSLCQLIVSDVVSLRDRGKWQGILGAFNALANGVGPVIGGALATVQWRWIFWLNLPICAIASAMVWYIMPLKKVEGHWKEKVGRIDFVGTILALLSTTLIILGLTWAGSEYAWDSAHVLCTLILGVVLAGVFLGWEKYSNLPVMPLYIFKSRMVCGACITQAINGWIFLVQTFYLPKFSQLAFGYSAIISAALLIPLTVVQTISSTIGGLLVTWTGKYKLIILSGWALWVVGVGLISTLDETSGLGKQIGYSILAGFGVGQTLQASLVAVQAGVERKDMAVVTSTRNFVRNLGGTLGLAISGTILNNITRSRLLEDGVAEGVIDSVIRRPESARNDLDSETRKLVVDVYRMGFRVVFLTSAALATVAFMVALLMMPQINLDRADDEKLKEEGRKWVEEGKKERQKVAESGESEQEQAIHR
ncbi:hypothetical protein E3P92_03333 [Wallemia ichthyophaga]|uniref:Major facilitator superfamily (MFS) profile domain-containing protein n=2 Tax=Wallemia ichthyophaga TaxID=245174 RepID=A0A4T0J9Z9_WALIC|nr:uncharacterized protein J056_003147 [Wallemia ichthyophaga EXF-994]TIA88335.1 hypothetical protein E3P97_03552 [Wallemia ichthyophaga]EOR03690.1 hypothetical protein J056_003147 [Wallemia ichthyophaga EXF-994]TIB09947.1 hypothetical protein E3P92_03333 [Wallemia ichthyophaga]TIB28186.1 hypothetical protein E3P86_03905 [Wallemia ichthyophaga]TIB29085.1 hypothetical protein E3P85_03339 [Wallemia ichthyophaga]